MKYSISNKKPHDFKGKTHKVEINHEIKFRKIWNFCVFQSKKQKKQKKQRKKKILKFSDREIVDNYYLSKSFLGLSTVPKKLSTKVEDGEE